MNANTDHSQNITQQKAAAIRAGKVTRFTITDLSDPEAITDFIHKVAAESRAAAEEPQTP